MGIYTATFVEMIDKRPDMAEPILLKMLKDPKAKYLVVELLDAAGRELFLKMTDYSDDLKKAFADFCYKQAQELS